VQAKALLRPGLKHFKYNNRNTWIIDIEGYTFGLATWLASRALTLAINAWFCSVNV
jgi:hypothetical protein